MSRRCSIAATHCTVQHTIGLKLASNWPKSTKRLFFGFNQLLAFIWRSFGVHLACSASCLRVWPTYLEWFYEFGDRLDSQFEDTFSHLPDGDGDNLHMQSNIFESPGRVGKNYNHFLSLMPKCSPRSLWRKQQISRRARSTDLRCSCASVHILSHPAPTVSFTFFSHLAVSAWASSSSKRLSCAHSLSRKASGRLRTFTKIPLKTFLKKHFKTVFV